MEETSLQPTIAEPTVPLQQANPRVTEAPVSIQKKSPWPIILSALLIITLALAGYFYWQNLQLKSQLAVQSSPSPLPTASLDPTANWKTYSNEKMKLSLKYPSDANLQIFTFPYNDLVFALNTAQYDPTFLDVTYLPNTELQDWYKKAYSATQQEQETAPTLQAGANIDGVPSYQADFNLEGAGKVRFIFIPVGKGLYQVNIPVNSNTMQYQILSTFKFTDSSSTSDWQHYLLKDGKSSLDHPVGWTVVDNTKQLDLYNDGNLLWAQDVVIAKAEYKIKSRNPLAWGPGVCIFPDNSEYNEENVTGTKYATYTEFIGEGKTFRRVKLMLNSNKPDLIFWGICSKDPNSQGYGSVSGFGDTGYETPKNYDAKTIEIMDQIVLSLTVKK